MWSWCHRPTGPGGPDLTAFFTQFVTRISSAGRAPGSGATAQRYRRRSSGEACRQKRRARRRTCPPVQRRVSALALERFPVGDVDGGVSFAAGRGPSGSASCPSPILSRARYAKSLAARRIELMPASTRVIGDGWRQQLHAEDPGQFEFLIMAAWGVWQRGRRPASAVTTCYNGASSSRDATMREVSFRVRHFL